MSRVIPFSRTYPGYHPSKGEPTYFVEKIWNGIGLSYSAYCDTQCEKLNIDKLIFDWSVERTKYTTIRAGHRWKEGDWFSPRVWSGKPYYSKQIIIAPDIQIKKIWTFKIVVGKKQMHILLNGEQVAADTLGIVAMNDGLSFVDFMHWFKYPGTPFDGQIICWDENINY